MKKIHRLLMFVLLSLIVVGCSSLKGTVSGDRYQSPINNFTIEIPNFADLKIQDTYDNEQEFGRVSFTSGFFWGLWAITYLQLPANFETTFKDNEKRDSVYSDFLKSFAVPSLFSPVSQDTRIVHEEFLGEGENRAYFAVVFIPEGSTMVDLKQNKRLNSLRGLLIFDKLGFMYMLEQESGSLGWDPPRSVTPDEIESSQTILKRIKDGMVFK